MKQNFAFLFLLFLTTVFGQKTVNETLISKIEKKYVYQNHQILNLKDLRNTDEEFYFRFNNSEIIIELFKNKDDISLNSYQYFFKSRKNKETDTVIKKTNHSKEVAVWLYENIEKYSLEKLNPNKTKPNLGKSGVFMTDDYYLEFSNNENYSIKSFPYSSRDSIKQNYTLNDFVTDLYGKIEFEKIKNEFKDSLPNGYDYKNLFSYSFYKMSNSNAYLDYDGNYRLPLGFTFGYSVDKIKKKTFNVGLRFNIKNNFDNNLYLENVIWKRKIFGNDKTYYDSFRFIYEYNKLDYVKTLPKYENYKIYYNGTIEKYFSFGFGYNQLKTENKFNGMSLGFSKRFESINLEPYYTIDLYENKITNYKVGIDKTFQLKINNKTFFVSTSLFYEKTFDFKSLNLSLFIPIKFWTIN